MVGVRDGLDAERLEGLDGRGVAAGPRGGARVPTGRAVGGVDGDGGGQLARPLFPTVLVRAVL